MSIYCYQVLFKYYIFQQQRPPEDFERNCYFITAKKVEMIFPFIRIIKTYGNLLKLFFLSENDVGPECYV